MTENPEQLQERPIDLREVVHILWRRRWLFLIPCLVTTLGGLAGAILLPSVYQSSVVLVMEGPQQLPNNLRGITSKTNTDAQADIMRGQVRNALFLRSVITASGVRTDPETRAWALRRASRYPGLGEDEVVDAFLSDYLRNAIVVTVLRIKGNVFQITVSDRVAARAHKLAEAVANQFVVSSQTSQLQEVGRIQEFTSGQEGVYKRKLEEAEQRLEAFRRSVISSTMAGSTVNAANVTRAQMLAGQAQVEVGELRQRLAGIRQAGGRFQDGDLRAIASPEAQGLIAEMLSLERQLASMSLTEMAGDALGGLRLSILRRRSDLVSELAVNAGRVLPAMPGTTRDQLVDYRVTQAELAGVEARREWLARQIGAYEHSQVLSPDRQLQEQRLNQEVDTWRSLHNTFLQQSAAAQIQEAFENAKVGGRFDIISPATRPTSPAKPNRPALVLLSLLAGLGIGAGTVKVVEHHDHSVKNAEEVEKLLGLPVLGAIPRVAELEVQQRRRPMPFASAPGGAGAQREHGMLHRLKVESPIGLEFRRIYLKLARMRGRQLPHTLLVTSATRGEGKTTTTACLAITLARELRQKVLLVDFDLRSPSLHRALGLPSSSWGLAQILGQRHFDERFVRATVLPHLEFLPAGKSDRPAAELIESDLVEWFVKEAASRYSLVIMDCAPNLAVPDPLIIGNSVEGVLYVVKAGSTVRKAAEYGVKVQREARDNVIGVLINDSGEILPSYYGYRARGYGYGRGEVAGGES